MKKKSYDTWWGRCFIAFGVVFSMIFTGLLCWQDVSCFRELHIFIAGVYAVFLIWCLVHAVILCMTIYALIRWKNEKVRAGWKGLMYSVGKNELLLFVFMVVYTLLCIFFNQ